MKGVRAASRFTCVSVRGRPVPAPFVEKTAVSPLSGLCSFLEAQGTISVGPFLGSLICFIDKPFASSFASPALS